jgi:SAM-dependent methyltransferase
MTEAVGQVAAGATGRLVRVSELEEAGRLPEALAEAWRALEEAPDDSSAKARFAGLVGRNPRLAEAAHRPCLERLLVDAEIDPFFIAQAGWLLLHAAAPSWSGMEPGRLAERLESCDFALSLLEQSYLAVLEVEQVLTRVRRWLLLSGEWPRLPRLVAALAAQARHNNGAWLIDPEEERQLDAEGESAIAGAYRPPRHIPGPPIKSDDAVTRRVSEQYRGWPYPSWSRITRRPASSLREVVGRLTGGSLLSVPPSPEILVAGCGTGRDAAVIASSFPDARVTAIDISETSLAFAAQRCRSPNIEFRLLDLHAIGELGRSYDFIHCSGVLHHISDPEAGWAKLVDVLRPGAVMRVMLYSRVGRLKVQAARKLIADYLGRPVDDDLLRAVRRRLIDHAPTLLGGSPDFYTLGGIYDLLLHQHEDCFDVPRIVRALDRLGLDLLAFVIPASAARAAYRRDHPEDPLFRDAEAWASLEKKNPFVFAGMYDFWCHKR